MGAGLAHQVFIGRTKITTNGERGTQYAGRVMIKEFELLGVGGLVLAGYRRVVNGYSKPAKEGVVGPLPNSRLHKVPSCWA